MFNNIAIIRNDGTVRGQVNCQLGFGYSYWFIGGELIMTTFDLFDGGNA